MILRAQQIIDQVFEARIKKKVVRPAQPLMNPEELDKFVLSGLGFADFINMLDLVERYSLDINGKVTRPDSHYVHERTTSFNWTVEVGYRNDIPDQDSAQVDDLANEIENSVGEEIVTINQKIYRALNQEYDYQHNDETVEDNIRVNDYDFNEDGKREEEGGFKFDTLPDERAKETARDWFREGCCDDSFWYEHIYEEWKAELESMGFGDPDINFSGFSSQGDGASFTCTSFDFIKYAHFFMSGRDKDKAEGHPYTDDLNESDLGIDMDQLAKDSIFTSFDVLGAVDSGHQSTKYPSQQRHCASYRSPDEQVFIQMSFYDRMGDSGFGHVNVIMAVTAWIRGEQLSAISSNVNRQVTFKMPADSKSNMISVLLDFWTNIKVLADKRPFEPKKLCNSLAYRLSALCKAWNRDHSREYFSSIHASHEKWRADNPEKAAAEDARTQARMNRPMPPEPSDEKLRLRAEMKQWKKDRDAKRLAAWQPQQESENDDLLSQMGDVANRASVSTIGNVMAEQPVRYMTGAKQYHWHSTTPDWRWKITCDVTVYSEQLPRQPWEVNVKVYDNSDGDHFFIDKLVVTDNEKNIFGLGIHKMIPLLVDISERAWNESEQLLKELEIVFNRSLGERETASPRQKIATFSRY